MKELYTSDYKLNSIERDHLNEEISDLGHCGKVLIKSFSDSDEIRSITQKIIEKMEVLQSQLDEKYPEGVYRLRRNIVLSMGSLIKREEGDSCENCIFNKIPCLGIKYEYGCYTTKEHSPNANPLYGELVRTGHFVEYKENKD